MLPAQPVYSTSESGRSPPTTITPIATRRWAVSVERRRRRGRPVDRLADQRADQRVRQVVTLDEHTGAVPDSGRLGQRTPAGGPPLRVKSAGAAAGAPMLSPVSGDAPDLDSGPVLVAAWAAELTRGGGAAGVVARRARTPAGRRGGHPEPGRGRGAAGRRAGARRRRLAGLRRPGRAGRAPGDHRGAGHAPGRGAVGGRGGRPGGDHPADRGRGGRRLRAHAAQPGARGGGAVPAGHRDLAGPAHQRGPVPGRLRARRHRHHPRRPVRPDPRRERVLRGDARLLDRGDPGPRRPRVHPPRRGAADDGRRSPR